MHQEGEAQRAHVGWSMNLFEEALRACEDASAASLMLRARSLGVAVEALASIWHQTAAANTRRCAHLHREKAREYRAAWEYASHITSAFSNATLGAATAKRC